jgi:hypothetical protein
MASHTYDVAEIPPPRSHKPKRTNRVLGDYTLSKTLGAGSMGKVSELSNTKQDDIFMSNTGQARNS